MNEMMVTTGGSLPMGSLTTDITTQPYWPYDTSNCLWYSYPTAPPTVCLGDVHVFPCPHCDKCKCGAATVKRAKKKA